LPASFWAALRRSTKLSRVSPVDEVAATSDFDPAEAVAAAGVASSADPPHADDRLSNVTVARAASDFLMGWTIPPVSSAQAGSGHPGRRRRRRLPEGRRRRRGAGGSGLVVGREVA